MKQVWLLPLAFVAAIGMTACAAAIDEPTDGAVTTDETVTTDEAVEPLQSVGGTCYGIVVCHNDDCYCVGVGTSDVD